MSRTGKGRSRGEGWVCTQRAIVNAYKSKQSIESICREYRVPISTVYNVIRRHGVEPLRASYSEKIEGRKQEAADLYLSGVSTQEIAERLDMAIMTVYLALRAAGVNMPNASDRAKRALTPEQEIEMVDLFRTRAMNVPQLARRYKISSTCTYRLLREAGFQFHSSVGPKMQTIPYESRSGRVCNFRSSWEHLFACYLDQCGIEWTYESHMYKLSDGTIYIPDFWVPAWTAFVEVKGLMTAQAQRKIDLFRTEHPDLKLVILNRRAFDLLGLKAVV